MYLAALSLGCGTRGLRCIVGDLRRTDALVVAWELCRCGRWAELSFPGGSSGKEPACQRRRSQRCGFNPCVRKIPRRRPWQPTPVFLPEEFHGQRSLVGYRPWGRKGWDTTEHALSAEGTLQHKFWLQALNFRFSHLGVVLKELHF